MTLPHPFFSPSCTPQQRQNQEPKGGGSTGCTCNTPLTPAGTFWSIPRQSKLKQPSSTKTDILCLESQRKPLQIFYGRGQTSQMALKEWKSVLNKYIVKDIYDMMFCTHIPPHAKTCTCIPQVISFVDSWFRETSASSQTSPLHTWIKSKLNI